MSKNYSTHLAEQSLYNCIQQYLPPKHMKKHNFRSINQYYFNPELWAGSEFFEISKNQNSTTIKPPSWESSDFSAANPDPVFKMFFYQCFLGLTFMRNYVKSGSEIIWKLNPDPTNKVLDPQHWLILPFYHFLQVQT